LQEKADRFQLEKERERDEEEREESTRWEKKRKKEKVRKKNNKTKQKKKSFRNDISLSFWFDFCSVGWWWRLLEQRSGMP